MGKIKKFGVNFKKLSGGLDPANLRKDRIRLVQEFILSLGFNPDECIQENANDTIRWVLSISEDEELEVLVEGLKKPSETTVYMGVNIATVPVRGATDVLITALEIADGLVGIKVSLVGHFLVLSGSLGLAGTTLKDLEYHYKLITAQQDWFKATMAEELGWETWPEGV